MNVAVLMGGTSSEREISLRSGSAVARGLQAAGHKVSTVDVRGADFPLPEGTEAVFVALHGAFGEDGGVQRELRRRGMPFTGSDENASRLAFDKRLSKRIFQSHAIPTPTWEILSRDGWPTLPWPLVLKPPCQGSTLGINLVKNAAAWEKALNETLRYDSEAIVECFIAGRELTVGIVDGEPLAVIEIMAPGGWYDYRAKYVAGKTMYDVPARITANQSMTCRRLAEAAYRVLGCRGLGRVDFRMREDGAFYVLEVNTIPGFTETSLLPKAARYEGMDFACLCDRILRTAAVG